LNLSSDGGFSYLPEAGFNGTDNFTYQANDGITNSNPAIVSILVGGPGILFWDDFTRAADPGPLSPWVAEFGSWMVTGGVLQGSSSIPQRYSFICLTNSWTDYAVQARIQFPTNAYGGGLSGRLNPVTGAHYAAWIYPEGSPGGSKVLKLIKFQSWTSFGYTNTGFMPMQQVSLPAVGTNWHTLKLGFQGNQIAVFYDSNQVMSVTDVEPLPYASGGVSIDMWMDAPYTMSVDDLIVSLLVRIQSINLSGGMAAITWSAASGYAYKLQYKETLTGTNWIDLPPNILATGPVAAATNAVAASTQRFYRVMLLP
jgi:hypothetical protein